MPDQENSTLKTTASDVLDRYFLETRAKLLDIAATLDRLDRTPDASTTRSDSRITFLHQSLAILQQPGPNRAESIQRLYSVQ